MKNREKKGIFDARTLGGYIKQKYKEEYRTEISPIRLQKALYFLFAFWGGMVRKSKNNPEYVESDLSEQNEILFYNDIKAWAYGPVIPDVYKKEKKLEEFYSEKEDIFNGNTFLRETIDSILRDLFEIADFKLVSISYEDKSWQDNYDSEEIYHNTTIEKESIIQEYAKRKCI